jgi:predicted small secreted protein
MTKERKAYAPFSLTSEAGVAQTPVEGYIDVRQEIYPIVSTGTINENGKWTGVKSDDAEFFDFQTDLAVADNGEVISNKVIDMYGFSRLNLAIQVSATGNYFFELLFGGDVDDRYLNLQPIVTNRSPKATIRTDGNTNTFITLLSDQESLDVADVWKVFQIDDLQGFKLKLKITNQTGGASDIQTAIQRLL